ncbi:CoA-acylating methylmalonate-semialdehyde dehydrogenase [Plantactinospora soyae]|uniref:methylmalonate-semialdehyde dehydrogenase (CoA acylating) n=1 Tax=Plantactinospora soyae TaxID=1544732 RepID=A0A927MA52_9ACTN|nr:CoA-acylating methylmalonate-semialdehyde dehydrogenase [Plantactinospora soyae]MBE1489785.1 malonate-semialdehyde dehydrogenase (acetylating)/methylmalonate-semialdehyde dehydrogenase [Plantactinospora soyae]
MATIRHWIGGAWSAGSSDRTTPVWDPATGQQRAEVSLAGPAEVDAAVRAAAVAAESWAETSVAARTRVLFRFRDLVDRHAGDLARLITDEHGKVLSDARGEVQRGLEVVEFACGIGELLKGVYSDQVSSDVDAFTFRQQLGVVAGITPFNFPAMVPMWMHPVAIATGNTFVLKPSERVPSASGLVAELYAEAGLPSGVFNVVHGDRVAVDAILDHPDVAAVSFVGSTPIARYIHERAARAGKRVQALGGAKNHAVVLPDADLDFAAEQLVAAGFGSAGQRCMAISAVVAVGTAAEPLLKRISALAGQLPVGPGRDERSQLGPVISAQARQRILGAVGTAVEAGAELVLDGTGLRVPGHEEGFFVGPCVLDRVTPEMAAYREEIFGPVLCVLRVDTLDEALRLVNANPYGNGAALFTASGEAARTFHRRVQVGMVGVNVPIPVPMAYHSFGGWKDSLFGDRHVHGPEGVGFYTRAKAVTTRWPRSGATEAAPLSFPTSR